MYIIAMVIVGIYLYHKIFIEKTEEQPIDRDLVIFANKILNPPKREPKQAKVDIFKPTSGHRIQDDEC